MKMEMAIEERIQYSFEHENLTLIGYGVRKSHTRFGYDFRYVPFIKYAFVGTLDECKEYVRRVYNRLISEGAIKCTITEFCSQLSQ